MKLYYVHITDKNGIQSTLSHRGRLSWGIKTARKHAADFMRKHGGKAEVKEW